MQRLSKRVTILSDFVEVGCTVSVYLELARQFIEFEINSNYFK